MVFLLLLVVVKKFLSGALLVGSDICNSPISCVGTDSDKYLGQDNSCLYFYFAKYGAKAGCLHCKDLVEVGSSTFKHSCNCPRVTDLYEVLESDSDSNPTADVPVVDSTEVTMLRVLRVMMFCLL